MIRRMTAVAGWLLAGHALLGLLYWYGLYPVHALIFSGLVRRLAARAETRLAPAG